jgi:enamine deaminase RidA (YjgF/YER057c/UK114 family)
MMQIEEKLAGMGLELVSPSAPLANFVQTQQAGSLLFVAGHLPRQPDGSVLYPGKVGREVTEEQGYEAARLAAVNCLASIKAATGNLDRVRQIVKLLVMVNADPEYQRHFAVANGASDLLVELYGDCGRHARSAVGMGGLPRGSCVEVEMIVELAD